MKKYLLFFASLVAFGELFAQEHSDSVLYSLNLRFAPGAGTYAPFLSTVNQYDRYSLTPNGLAAWGRVEKKTGKTFDYGFGLELNANVSSGETRLFGGEYYLEGKAGPFLAILGAKREVYGNQDPVLSSGGLISSANNRPLPGFCLETEDWVDVPFTRGYLEFSGGMFNGWFTDKTVTANTLLHHKWLQGRIGGSFPLTINYGLHHVAQWGGNSPDYGQAKVDLENFMRIFFAKSGSASSPDGESINTLGNHIVSQHLGLTLKTASFTTDIYWQTISEDPPVLTMNKLYNKRDGLWGLSVRLPKIKALQAITAEFLSTTDQGGPWHDLDGVIYGGMDSYYNNGMYPNGYSYYGMTMGHPWLTSPKYNTDGDVRIQNNCVRLYYGSCMGEVRAFKYRFTGAYSQNWGLAKQVPTIPREQLSVQLEVFHALPFLKHTEGSVGLSADRGTQYGNNTAVLLGVRYFGVGKW